MQHGLSLVRHQAVLHLQYKVVRPPPVQSIKVGDDSRFPEGPATRKYDDINHLLTIITADLRQRRRTSYTEHKGQWFSTLPEE